MLRVVTFTRITKRRLHAKKIGILGVPFEKGAPEPSYAGVKFAPDAIRKAGLIEQLKGIHQGVDVKDYGNVSYTKDAGLKDFPNNMKCYADVVSCNEVISNKVQGIMKDGRVCLTIGGDHSIAIGTIDGHMKSTDSDVCVLYVDAHADINTNKTSSTQNVHGMTLAFLATELTDYWPNLPGLEWLKPALSARNIAYIGLRSVDPYERLIIDRLGITAFGMDDVVNYGITHVINMALKRIDPDKNKSIHISFDIDSLDYLEAPSCNVPIRGGLMLREALQIVETVQDTGRLNALDLVEVNPEVGDEQDIKKTIRAAINVILAAFGEKRGGSIPKNALPLQTFPPTRDIIQ